MELSPPKKKLKRSRAPACHQKSPVCVWDFTWSKKIEPGPSYDGFAKHCKKWCYQLEKGTKEGLVHYQGRISLKMKVRLSQVTKLFPKGIHWSVTSDANKTNMFYVMKEDTRIGGPWSDLDVYIPRQIREIKELWPWQKTVLAKCLEWDTRTINVIIDPDGNKGKSTLVMYAMAHKLAQQLPAANNYKDLMRMAMNVHDAVKFKAVFIDMPRGLNKEHVGGMFSAIESIKNGYLWDDRYAFKQKLIDSPAIWVFTNKTFARADLTDDRWKLWQISNKKLIRFGEK